MESKLIEMVVDLYSNNKELRNKVCELSDELIEMRDSRSHEYDASSASLNQMESVLNHVNTELEDARATVEAKTREIGDLTAKLDRLQQEHDAKCKEAQVYLDQINHLEVDAKKGAEELKSLRKAIADMKVESKSPVKQKAENEAKYELPEDFDLLNTEEKVTYIVRTYPELANSNKAIAELVDTTPGSIGTTKNTLKKKGLIP